ncbi:hypothetical protein [Arcobacter sp. F2176]|uniref:hypothetical protein n=1 Tax=Arcobacter sp. F2176 TaxID=2044511 RepID=UPI00100B4F15|nr:hypothetical protein [Arcobacter sp. F2176]RXJ82171.1 hypothetical protein CRU95_04600 [Arcobacter sp. F2176]
MKKFIYVSLALCSLVFAAVSPGVPGETAANNKTGVIYVKNNDKIDITKKTEKVEAKLDFLDKKKYDGYSLLGEYNTTKTIDGKVKVSITWQKVKKDKTEVILNDPFSSALKTTTPIEKDSKFRAMGNLEQLNLNLNEVKEKAEKLDKTNISLKENPGVLNGNKSSLDGNKKSAALNGDLETLTMESNPNRYQDTNTDAGSNSSYDNGNNNGFEEPTVTIDTEKSCQNVISNGTVQFKQLVNEICMSIGSPVPIYTTTKGCTPKVDYKTKEVFVATKKVADKEGVETTVESCTIDYDNPQTLKSTYTGCGLVFRKDLKAQVQQEQLFFTFDREDVKVGACTDSALSYPVDTYKEWNKECSPLIDYDNNKVQFAFREVAQVNGTVAEVTPCKFDTTTHELDTTYDGCDVYDDFTNKVSIQKEKYFYMFENKKQYVGECQDSSVKFEHYLTPDTCEFQRLDDNHIVYNKRVAYKDVNGIVHYLTQCKPSEDGSIELTTLQCGYEHDFANNQSYPMSKQVFTDPQTNEEIEVSSCSKDPLNFPHQTEHCSWENDDENKFSNEWKKTFFVDTRTNETKFLDITGANEQGCVKGSPIPYVQSSENIKFIKDLGFKRLVKNNDETYSIFNEPNKIIDHSNGIFPISKNTTKFNITSWTCNFKRGDSIIGDANGFNMSYSQCIGGDITQNVYTKSCGASGAGKWYTGPFTEKYCTPYQYWEKIGEYQIITKFLRADGTYLDIPTKSIYRIIR